MAGRRFTDQDGRTWEVIVLNPREWAFRPVEGDPRTERLVAAPGHTDDPFELSREELQKLLDRSHPRYPGPRRPPPFPE